LSVSSVSYLGYNEQAPVASLGPDKLGNLYFVATKKRHLSGKRGANAFSAKSNQ
jgi:hypothetical protein